MCRPVGCARHVYVNGGCIVVSFQKIVQAQDQVVERCMAGKWMVHWFWLEGAWNGAW